MWDFTRRSTGSENIGMTDNKVWILDGNDVVRRARTIAGRYDLVYDYEGEFLMDRKHIFLKDLEKCPFLPGHPSYERWKKENCERLEALSKNREELLVIAKRLASKHVDHHVRKMAHFIIWILGDD